MEDFAMIPAKEAKDMLYKMLSENFISLQVTSDVILQIRRQGRPQVKETEANSASSSETNKKD